MVTPHSLALTQYRMCGLLSFSPNSDSPGPILASAHPHLQPSSVSYSTSYIFPVTSREEDESVPKQSG